LKKEPKIKEFMTSTTSLPSILQSFYPSLISIYKQTSNPCK